MLDLYACYFINFFHSCHDYCFTEAINKDELDPGFVFKWTHDGWTLWIMIFLLLQSPKQAYTYNMIWLYIATFHI